MNSQELEKRKGCNKRVVLFFIFAICCVAAFLIVGLVKTCSTDHEEKVEEEQLLQDEVSMAVPTDYQLFS